MSLKLYNTLTLKKENFVPVENGTVKMFVCGPTVYDNIHLGHARTFIFFDILARYLSSQRFQINFIVNVSDIDDKIIDKAKKEGISYKILANNYANQFFFDLKSLGVNTITRFAKVSDFIEQSRKQVNNLVKKGYAYRTNGDVYFNTNKYPDYGKLSHQTPVEIKLKRLDINPNKQNQSDFLLWKNIKNQDTWPSILTRGRPWWHIQDTSITISIFGPQHDIHGGAIELVFPHHEAQIAQAEALTGIKPHVKYWLHTGILKIEGRKMSKSLGNALSVKETLKKYEKDAVRLYFSSYNYGEDIEFDLADLDSAVEHLKVIRKALLKIKKLRDKNIENLTEESTPIKENFQLLKKKFLIAMDDNLNIPKAVKVLQILVTTIEKKLSIKSSKNLIFEAHVIMLWMLNILGLESNPYLV